MWDPYQQIRIEDQEASLINHKSIMRENSGDLRDLTILVRKMALVNQALFELLKDKTGINEADLRRKVKEVDLRDGREDGKLKAKPLKCPKCGVTVSAGAMKCGGCGATIAPEYPYEA